MKKEEFIARYGQAAYDRVKEQANARQKAKKTNQINESIKEKQIAEEEPDDDSIEVSGYTLKELDLLNKKYRIKRRDFINTTFEEVSLSNILNAHKRSITNTYKVLNLRGEYKYLTVQTFSGELINQFSETYGDIYAIMDKLKEKDFNDYHKMRAEFMIEMNNIRVKRAMDSIEEVDYE